MIMIMMIIMMMIMMVMRVKIIFNDSDDIADDNYDAAAHNAVYNDDVPDDKV
jgi:hypothetical protein